MAEFIITELQRDGSAVSSTPVTFKWTSTTHTSPQNALEHTLAIKTKRRTS